MNFDPNPLFFKMAKLFKENYTPGQKVIIFNEGGSRSSKTWDFFHLLTAYCDHNRNKGKDCYIHRDTLTNCRDYTLKDFIGALKAMNLFDNSKLSGVGHKPFYDLFGNNIYFRGLDDEKSMEGYPSNISFFNELLEIQNESRIAGIKMRCTELIVADWNPKYTDHWAFDYEGRPNVFFTHSTYKNNKHCPLSVVTEIESYCPWNFEDLGLPEAKRRPNIENIKNKTANRVRWKVYGEGNRCAPEGLVFPSVTYIDKFPDGEIDRIFWGLDFGYTNDPTALCRIGVSKHGNKVFLEKHLYNPFDNALELEEVIKTIVPQSDHIWADCADPGMISDIRRMNVNIFPAKKFPGCIEYRVDILKRKDLHIVRDKDFKKEQENYRYQEINGILTSKPDPNSKHCHLWDATGYACQHELR